MKAKLCLTVLILSVIAIIGLAGCGAAITQNPVSSSPLLSNEGASPVSVNVTGQQGIWVNGQGKVTVNPDVAAVNLGVSVRAVQVADAQNQAAEAMNKVVASLISNGVDQKDISTRYYTINPVTKYDSVTEQSTVTGYEVSDIANVTFRTIEKVGMIIDGVTAAGGDATRVNSITFSVAKPEQYYSEARTLAMNDAKAKAQQLATLAGVTLGRPYYINESTTIPPVPYDLTGRALEGASPTTPISPGQTDVILNIQVAYNIQ
jgi:uncharacterized protein YggE